MPVPPRVVFLDDNKDLRDLMGILIRVKLGAECLCFSHLDDMRKEAARVLDAKLAILDINLGYGQPSGIDAYEWLRQNRFTGAILFLTGHANSSPLVADAVRSGATLMQKPVEPEKLISTLRRYL